MGLLRLLAVVPLAAFLPAPSLPQATFSPGRNPASRREESPRASIRVDTSLVLIPVTVNDPLNRPVTGLERGNFRIFDDHVEQQITAFAMDDAPVAVGLVFDTSGSMGDKLRRSRMAAREFFRLANDQDEFFLVEFSDAPHLQVPLTSNPGKIENQLTFSKSKGSTALLDAILLALQEIRKSRLDKKALLVISDGGDNHSRYSAAEVRKVVRESNVLIYSVGIFGGASTAEERFGPSLLSQISEQTGGRMYPASAAELPDIAHAIGVDLRNRYVLGYRPKNETHDGRYHRVDVKIVVPRGMPKLTAHWRTGYYAPEE